VKHDVCYTAQAVADPVIGVAGGAPHAPLPKIGPLGWKLVNLLKLTKLVNQQNQDIQ